MNTWKKGRKGAVRKLGIGILLVSLLLFAHQEVPAYAQAGTIQDIRVNGVTYSGTADLGTVNTLTHQIGVSIVRTGDYASYRAEITYYDSGKGNPSFGKEFSGSSNSLTFDSFTFSAGGSTYPILIEVYGMDAQNVKIPLDSRNFNLTLGNYDTTAPVISSKTPDNGATNVPLNSTVVVVFNEAVDPLSVTNSNMTLKSSSAVNGTVSLDGDGRTVTFQPNAQLAFGTTYTVTVNAGGIKDLAGNGVAKNEWTFTTLPDPAAAPVITSRSPASGATNVAVNTTVTMDFNKALNTSTVAGRVSLLKGSTTVPATVTAAENNAGLGRITITPTSALDNLTEYTVVVANNLIEDTYGLKVAGSTWKFTTVAGANPVIQSRTPASGETNVPVDTDVRITFSQAMNSSTISTSNIYLRRSGTSTNISASISYNSSTQTAVLKPSSPLAADTTYVVTVTANVKNATGLAMTAASWNFTTSRSAITVTNRAPAADENNVPLNAVVKFRFSGNMTSSTINTSNIYIRKAGSSRNLDVTLAYNSTTREVTLTPKADLDLNTKYTVYLTNKVQDSSRLAINPVDWSFTTTRTDTLRVVDQTPDADATNVDVDTDITIKFSKELRATTVTDSTIYLRQVGSSRNIAADMTYSRTSKTVVLRPDESLRANTEYRVTITTGLRDSDGNAIVSTNWTFKTGLEAVSISTKDPVVNATGVPADKTITFRFSRAMTSNTVNSTNIYLRQLGTTTNTPVAITYNTSNFTVTMKPASVLEYGKMYTVYVSDRVKDADGRFIKNESWSFATATKANDPIRFGTATRPLVRLDGSYMTFTDAFPYITNGTTMLPYRAIFEALGAQVGYDNSNPKRVRITGSLGTNQIVMYVGETTAYRNGQPIALRVAPVIINGRTMVPLRFIGESLGVKVQWDPAHYNVILETK